MKKIFPFIFCILFSQETYQGQITFSYTGTESGSFTSLVQDSVLFGTAINQMGEDTSSFIIASVTQQDTNDFDIFFAILQDSTFPVQPRTWQIPGSENTDDLSSIENIVVFMPGLDSAFVMNLLGMFSDTSSTGDSLNQDSLITALFTNLVDDLYLGLAGEFELTSVSDSTLDGVFYTTLIKPTLQIPPHMVMINNGEFSFTKIASIELGLNENPKIPKSIVLNAAYPNPFNPVTTLRITSNGALNSRVTLQIFDMNGRWVESLIQNKLIIGTREIQWQASASSSGIYFAVMQSNNNIQTTKLILLK